MQGYNRCTIVFLSRFFPRSLVILVSFQYFWFIGRPSKASLLCFWDLYNCFFIITARVRSTYDGRLCFHRCVSLQLLGGFPITGLERGVPHHRSGWGVPQVPPYHDWMGYPCPQPGLDGGGLPKLMVSVKHNVKPFEW